MKLTGQAVPSALATIYRSLVATNKQGTAGVTRARTTKKATHTTNVKPTRTQLRDYEAAVDFLIAYLTKKNGAAPVAGFRSEQITNIKAGTFDPLYWSQCVSASSQGFNNVPGSAPFTKSRAYAYADPANLPSVATYGAGAETGATPEYHGATIAGTFNDLGLTWLRTVYTLANKIQNGVEEPLFLKLTGSIAGTANARATRSLLSVIIKRWIVGAGSARLTTTEAPTVQPIQALYRYKTPRGVSPYFNLVHPLRLLYNVRSVKYEEPTGDLTKCVILVAPMPLMGYRNNNNTAASSALTVELELWQIKKGAGGFYARTNRWNQDGTRTDILVHNDGTTEDITAPNLGYYYVFYQICAETFFMWDGDHGISVTSDPDTGAFTWVLLDGKLNPTPLAVPWSQADYDAGNLYIQEVNWTATGWIITTVNQNSNFAEYWFISVSGALVGYYTDATAPDINLLGQQTPVALVYIKGINQYAIDENEWSGNTVIDWVDSLGNMVKSLDYWQYWIDHGGIDWVDYGRLFASDNHLYGRAFESVGGVNSAVIYQRDSLPNIELARVDLGNRVAADVAYHEGVIYIFPNDKTITAYAITEAGAISFIANPSGLQGNNWMPIDLPWVANK